MRTPRNRALDSVRTLCGLLDTEAVGLAAELMNTVESARDLIAPLVDLDPGIRIAFELLSDAATLALPLVPATAPAAPSEPA